MAIALYPGAFDPVTNGHIDIALRASRIFDRVVVAVYDSPSKSLLFDSSERVEFFTKAVADVPNIDVTVFSGLMVDYLAEIGGHVIVRGLRMGSDFDYEFEMALMNKKLAPEAEIVCLMTRLEYQFISSSLLKEVARLGGEIESLVPQHVATALRTRLA